MRVLVTGATTPVGAGVIDRLLADPRVEHVLAIGAGPGHDGDPRVTRQAVDLTRDRAVRELVHGPAHALGVDTVCHLALHRSARHEGPRVHARNVDATRQLLRVCAEVPAIRRFVYPSTAAVYALSVSQTTLLDEDAPLEFDPGAPQWVRDRVEADLTVCARMGLADVDVVVLRLAEILAPDVGGQLWDYLRSRVCLRPLGFDPMINLLSLDDATRAITLAITGTGQGVYNIAGADTLPMSRLIARWGRRDVAVPGPLLPALYRLRARLYGFEFRYDLNLRRFQFGGVIDDHRARVDLGYAPLAPIRWPVPPPALRADAAPPQPMRDRPAPGA